MRKALAVLVLIVALGIPVGAQSVDFLISLMRAAVEEYGIETVISVLEDLGYIGESEVAVNEKITEPTTVNATELTVRSPLWDDDEGEETLAYMVVSEDPNCYSYLEWGRDANDLFSLAEQMQWRQRFINECIDQ